MVVIATEDEFAFTIGPPGGYWTILGPDAVQLEPSLLGGAVQALRGIDTDTLTKIVRSN